MMAITIIQGNGILQNLMLTKLFDAKYKVL